MPSIFTTKKGDSGRATALNGVTYPKSHVLMECVGTLDEWRAHLSSARLAAIRHLGGESKAPAENLLWLMKAAVRLGTWMSDPMLTKPDFHVNRIDEMDLAHVEEMQAFYEARLDRYSSFILGGANPAAAAIDLACTMARRLERQTVRLTEAFPEADSALVLAFLNRISDCLYAMARAVENGVHLLDKDAG